MIGLGDSNHYESNKFDLVKDVFIIKHNL